MSIALWALNKRNQFRFAEKKYHPFFLGPGQWRAYVCAEEPFDRSNAARAVVNRDAFDEILSAFRYGYMEGTRKKVRIGKLLGGE